MLAEDRRDGPALARQSVYRHLDAVAGEIGGRVRTRLGALVQVALHRIDEHQANLIGVNQKAH